VGHVACIVEMRIAYKVLAPKIIIGREHSGDLRIEGKILLIWILKKEMMRVWRDLNQDRVHWQLLMNMVLLSSS
jgi:hypothetical protein